MSKVSHIRELDGIRGSAILMVILFHFGKDLPHNSLVSRITGLGWTGVDLFFVLSGFLITGILLRTRQSPNYFRNFYLRRALRIFPAYYVALSILIPVFSASNSLSVLLPGAHDLVVNLLYLGNWTPLLTTVNQGSLAHLWSLAVEEQFYLIWPLLVLLVPRRRLPWVAVFGCIIALILRIELRLLPEFTYRNTFCRMDSLMIGSLCAMMPASRWLGVRPGNLALIAGLLLSAAVIVDYKFEGLRLTIGLSLFGWAYGALLVTALHGPALIRTVLRTTPLTLLGKYSYGIYIYHQPVYLALRASQVVPAGWATFWVAFGSSVSLAVFSYALLENPLLRLKDKIAPSTNLEGSLVLGTYTGDKSVNAVPSLALEPNDP